MVSLLFTSLIITVTLSAGVVHIDEDGNLNILNVLYDGSKQNLAINKMEEKIFVWKLSESESITLGKYKQFDGGNLEFTEYPELPLSTFEELIGGEAIELDEKVILPFIAYMISFHGGEYKKLIRAPELDATHRSDMESSPPTPDSENRNPWPHKSTVYFFVPRYTCLLSDLGREYNKWFESGQFTELNEAASRRGEIIRTGDMIAEHYGTELTEDAVYSGVYRMVKRPSDLHKWSLELIGYLRGSFWWKLSDIVGKLEGMGPYGPGPVYWNACREDFTLKGIQLPGTEREVTEFKINRYKLERTLRWKQQWMNRCKEKHEEMRSEASVKMGGLEAMGHLWKKIELTTEEKKEEKKQIMAEFYGWVSDHAIAPELPPEFEYHECYEQSMRMQNFVDNVESKTDQVTKNIEALKEGSAAGSAAGSATGSATGSAAESAYKQYSNHYDHHHHHGHDMSYYDKLIEVEEMRDILRDLKSDKRRNRKYSHY